MAEMRGATVEDAGLIAGHRHRMFADNGFAMPERLCALDVAFEAWVRERIADGRYVGLLLEENGAARL